jgi:hypothetical protein
MRGEVPAPGEAVFAASTARPSYPSVSSLRPVDIDVNAADSSVGSMDDLALRRERLRRIVIGTLVACGLILIAAAGAQVARASAGAHAAEPLANLTQRAPAIPDSPAPAPVEPTSASSAAPTAAAPAAETPAIGTLRLRWPAVPGHVWLDGEKVTSSSAVVACGPHELRIGPKGHPRSVRIPCGGELRVSR